MFQRRLKKCTEPHVPFKSLRIVGTHRYPETGFWEAPRPAGCLYSIPHARTLTIFLELDTWTSVCPVAQPLSALAHGNLFRPEDGQDRLCGVLGIHAAGKKTATALPEVDI